MKLLFIFLLPFFITQAYAGIVKYDCKDANHTSDGPNIRQIKLNTRLSSGTVKKVDGWKVTTFNDFKDPSIDFGQSLDLMEDFYSYEILETVRNKKFHTVKVSTGAFGAGSDSFAYDSALLEVKETVHMIVLDPPNPWCIWDACQTNRSILVCKRR